MVELKLQASDDTIDDVQAAATKLMDEIGCSDSFKVSVLIVIEEIFVNIAHYAYGGEPGDAVVELEAGSKCFRAVFKDHGIPYNPLEKDDPDITLSAAEREIGGLGVFMVKEMSDRVTYEFSNGWNILTVEKDYE